LQQRQPPGSSAPLSGGGPSAVRHERPPASAALFADGQMTQTESSHARLLLAVDHQRPERRRADHPTCSLQFARCQNKVSERQKRYDGNHSDRLLICAGFDQVGLICFDQMALLTQSRKFVSTISHPKLLKIFIALRLIYSTEVVGKY
jgi:hypothetical protein